MPILQSDIDALTEALATGERMVRKGDKVVEYRSVDELLAARKFATVVVVLNFVNDPFELDRPNRERHAVWDGWAVRKETEPASLTEFPGRRWLFSRSHAVYALRRWLHARGTASAPEADDLGFGIDDAIDPGTPSEGGLHDLVVTRQQAHAEVTRTQHDAARSLAGADLQIQRIGAAGSDADQDLARARHRNRPVDDGEGASGCRCQCRAHLSRGGHVFLHHPVMEKSWGMPDRLPI